MAKILKAAPVFSFLLGTDPRKHSSNEAICSQHITGLVTVTRMIIYDINMQQLRGRNVQILLLLDGIYCAMIAHGDSWNTFRVTLDPSTGFKGGGVGKRWSVPDY